MNSRLLKKKKQKMLALQFVIVAGLALLGTAVMANPFVLDWRVIGFGTVTGTCQGNFGPMCTSISTGSVQGQHIGSGAYSLTLTTGASNPVPTNASNGRCFPANGENSLTTPNNITAASGDVINFNTVGWLCEEGAQGSPYHYNGTYRITSGTGRFATVVGGGSLTATFDNNPLAANTFMKADGTINF